MRNTHVETGRAASGGMVRGPKHRARRTTMIVTTATAPRQVRSPDSASLCSVGESAATSFASLCGTRATRTVKKPAR